MKKFLIIGIFLGVFSFVIAQEKPQETEKVKSKEEVSEKKETVAPAKPPVPGPGGPPPFPWWTKGAHFDEKRDNWKFHLEAELKYTYQDGTLESHLVESNLLFTVRKNLITNFLFMELGIIDAKQKFRIYSNESGEIESMDVAQEISMRKFQLVEILRYDFSKKFYFDLGFEGFRDDLSYVHKRFTYFGGLGYQLDIKKTHHNLMVGYGYEDTEYTSRAELESKGLPSFVPIDETPNSSAIYLQYKGTIPLSENISFHPSFLNTLYLKDERSDRWELKLRLMFHLRDNVRFFTVYEALYERNNTAKAAGAENLNSKIITGIKFMF